jgi:multisubunit Na+/H+ antiporter MnhB subunit
MKVRWGVILVATLAMALIILYVWPRLNQEQEREKVSFIALTIMGWLMAILLVFYPEMPGPTQMIDTIYRPLGRILEK